MISRNTCKIRNLYNYLRLPDLSNNPRDIEPKILYSPQRFDPVETR